LNNIELWSRKSHHNARDRRPLSLHQSFAVITLPRPSILTAISSAADRNELDITAAVPKRVPDRWIVGIADTATTKRSRYALFVRAVWILESSVSSTYLDFIVELTGVDQIPATIIEVEVTIRLNLFSDALSGRCSDLGPEERKPKDEGR
jgi:hypothetical protein